MDTSPQEYLSLNSGPKSLPPLSKLPPPLAATVGSGPNRPPTRHGNGNSTNISTLGFNHLPNSPALALVLLSYSQIGETAMPYQPISRYHLLPGLTYSAFSRPRREQPDGTYQIHLVKSQNPAYIPSDLEAWPIYYEAILETLVNYPDAHDAAIEAIRETRKKLAGLENLDVPPGTMPL